MKRLFSILIAFVFVLPLVGCSANKNLISVYAVSFFEDSVSLSVGEETTLEYKIFPSNATNKKVQFYSSSPSVVSVDKNGKIKLLRNEQAFITVTTVDGSFSSTCEIKPVVLPERIDSNESALDKKIRNTEGQEEGVLLLTVGQTKILPIDLVPGAASKDILSVSSKSSCVKITKGAEWLITGISYGTALVTVECNLVGGTTLKREIPVWVEPYVTDTKLLLIKDTTNSTLEKTVSGTTNKTSFELGLSEDKVFLQLSNDTRSGLSKQTEFSYIISDSSIFDIEVVNNYQSYIELGAQPSLFNVLKYIKINPKQYGAAKLYIATDAINSEGQPLLWEIEIDVADVATDANAAIKSDFEDKNGKSVVMVGEQFSVDVTTVASFPELEDKQIANRKIYYKIVEGVGSIGVLSVVDGVIDTKNNTFMALAACDNAKIEVYVSRKVNAPDLDSLAPDKIADNYIATSVEFSIADPIVDIFVLSNNNPLSDGSSLVVTKEVLGADKTTVIGETYGLNVVVLTKSGRFVDVSNTVWAYAVESGSATIEIDGKNIKILASGNSELVISVSDGKNEFKKTIYLQILE